MESWAKVPVIIEKGADWFAQIGVLLVQIVEEIGGGVLGGGEPFKAVQTGGPSGGCLPYALKEVAVDFDSLTQAGSMMGSGG